jgi:hypothetical protein
MRTPFGALTLDRPRYARYLDLRRRLFAELSLGDTGLETAREIAKLRQEAASEARA